ncbi:MAG: hypothetical protein R3F37_20835 [Candidatus Competibacteraceae bacterium]
MPLHLHLDPLGGVAGDMFVGALLDAWPELDSPLQAAFVEAGLTRFDAVATQRLP